MEDRMALNSIRSAFFILFHFVIVLFSANVNAAVANWYDAAKGEKQVLWYTSLNVEDSEKLIAAFTKKYPGVEVTVNRQSANSVLQKIMTERRSGKDIADVAPRRYQDLLHERWRGKLAVNLGNPTWIYSMMEFFGVDNGMSFLKKLAATSPRAYRGTTQLMQSVIAGDAEVGIALNHDGVIAFINKGAPVALSAVQDPVYADVHGIAILGNAQHPNAARLLVDFVVSKEGQTILAGLDKFTVRNDVATKLQIDRKTLRIVGPEARAKVEEYDKMMVDLFTK